MFEVDSVILNGLVADPASPVDGEIWHRSDLKKFRIRLNGVTTEGGKWSGRVLLVDPTNPKADFSTIQAAINVAITGDVILVAPGIYVEQLVIGAAPSNGHIAIIGMGGAALGDNGVLEPKVVIHPVMSTAEDAVVSNYDGTLTFTYLRNLFIKGNWRGISGKGYGIHWDVSATSKLVLDDCIVRPVGTLAASMGELLAARADSNGDIIAHNCIFGVTDVFNQLPADNDTIEVDGQFSAVHLYGCEVEKGTGNNPFGTIRLTNQGQLKNRGSKIPSIIPDDSDELTPYTDETFGMAPHADFNPCRIATTGNVNLAAAPNVHDGVTLVRNNRVLVHQQTDDTENGIYRIKSLGTGGDGVWERAADAWDTAQVRSGKAVVVAEGATYSRTLWLVDSDDPITLDIDALLFKNPAGVKGDQGDPGPAVTSTIQEATDTVTTASSADVLVPGMTVTPAAGTYVVLFSSVGRVTNKSADGYFSIWSGGVQVASSERKVADNIVDRPVSTQARVTVNGLEAIEARYRTTSDNVEARNRSLIAIQT